MPGVKEAVVRTIQRAVNLWGVRRGYVFLDDLKRLKVSLLVVWGAQDQTFPVPHSYRASEATPRANVRIFERCVHWPHMEKAEEFNALVRDFLSA